MTYPPLTSPSPILLLFFCLLCLTVPVDAADLEISESTQRLVLDQNLALFHDKNETHHIVMLTDGSTPIKWQTLSSQNSAIGMEAGTYWLKAQITNTSDKPLDLLLEVEYPSLSVVDLYQLDNNDNLSVIYSDAGLNSAFNHRPIQHRNIVAPYTFPAQTTTTLIWRVVGSPLVQFKAIIWEPQYFFSQDQSKQLLYGMLYGILAVMTLYNLFLFVSTQEKSYYYYSLFVIVSGYMLAADEGHLYQYVLTNQVWSKMALYAIAYALKMLLFSQFCIYFLNLHKHSPFLLRLIRRTAMVSACSLISIAATSNMALIYFTFATVGFLYFTALWAGIRVRAAGVISAGHFVIAIIVLVFSLIATNMSSLGLIHHSTATESLSAIGITVMLIFFSLALADRINQLQKESIESNHSMNKANNEKNRANAELLSSQMARLKQEQVAAQAKAESQAKSNFLAILGHEIRTPMNGVLNMTEMLRATHLDSIQHRHVNTIEQAGQSLLSITNDLRDYAKIEAGKMDIEFSSFNLETLIDDCVSTFALRACEKNINFIADLAPSIHPVLRGDTTKLRQIILNLLSNAFKFTEQGNILLKIRQTEKPAINGIELIFEIQDSGIGLTKEEQQRLFKPFQQAEATTYGRYGGSGLGLAISKQLAELMDGKIGVESEHGEGSTFWFTVRLLTDESPDSALLRQKSPRLAERSVLIVDPNPHSGTIIQRMLVSWGMLTTLVDNANSALNTLQDPQQKTDIILCDYHLEESNGIELAQEISAHTQGSPSFVLMAISRQLPNQEKLSKAGIEIILEKPITTALMHDVMVQAVADPQQIALAHQYQEEEHNINVLVVEDNQVNQMVMKGMLARINIVPDIAEDGLKAVEQFDKCDYDLILMDCEMPEMDGYEATKQIRAKEKLFSRSRSKVVALSAHARSDYKSKAVQVGMDEYMTKPITQSDLLKLVQSIQKPSKT